jgi:hypothetical protein
MDNRRLSTSDILAMGIINQPTPVTDIPDDRDRVDGQGEDWAYIGNEAVIAALDAGKLVSASNYYGIPNVWKVAEGEYRGALLQYRNVTESPSFTTAADAEEWFADRYASTDG